jgi:hypothetical protein
MKNVSASNQNLEMFLRGLNLFKYTCTNLSAEICSSIIDILFVELAQPKNAVVNIPLQRKENDFI